MLLVRAAVWAEEPPQKYTRRTPLPEQAWQRWYTHPGERVVHGGRLMATYRGSISIGRPVSEVFAFMAVPENAPKWMPDVVGIKRITPGPLALGSKFEETRKTGPGMKETFPTEVTKWVVDKEMGFVATGRGVTVVVHYDISAASGGTRADYVIDFKWKGFAKVMAVLIGPMIGSSLKKNHERLKACIEGSSKK
jgi:carbon monoxide dehydrogenase subunit G